MISGTIRPSIRCLSSVVCANRKPNAAYYGCFFILLSLFNRPLDGVAIASRTSIARSVPKQYQGGNVQRAASSRALWELLWKLTSAEKMRRILFSTIKILISAALLYLALRNVDLPQLASRINVTSLGWIALAILVTFLQIFTGVLRWREIGAACGAPLPTRQAMRFNLIRAFFNQTLPSSIGGDAVRLWLVARGGAGWRAATYSIFVDRAVGLIALAIVIVASLPWSYSLIDDPHGRSALLLADFAALGGGVGFLILGRLRWPWLKRWWATPHVHACAVIAHRVIFSREHGRKLAVLSLLVHVLVVVIAWCIVRSIAAPVLFGQVFQLIPPVMLITMLPISIAGWGVREATMGLAFGYAGLAANEGVNVSLLFGCVSFIIGAFGGLVWIFSAEKRAKGAAPIEVPE